MGEDGGLLVDELLDVATPFDFGEETLGLYTGILDEGLSVDMLVEPELALAVDFVGDSLLLCMGILDEGLSLAMLTELDELAVDVLLEDSSPVDFGEEVLGLYTGILDGGLSVDESLPLV